MEIKEFGKLAKLKINPTKNGKPFGKAFEVMFNPTTYSERFAIEYKKQETANQGVEEYVFLKSIPQEFQLNIIIDGTGASDFGISYLPVFKKSEKSVSVQVNRFIGLIWYPKDGHPNPLLIRWGDFSLHCRLKDVNIKYTLFDRSGNPLRAELDAKFIGLPLENQKKYKDRFDKELPATTVSTDAAKTNTAQPKAKDQNPIKTQEKQNGIIISVS